MISDELLLLKIIESNSSVSMLLDRGYSNSQVAAMLQKQDKHGNITIDENGVHLTEAGKKLLEEGFKAAKYKTKDTWILPQECMYREPISKEEIVLPDRI